MQNPALRYLWLIPDGASFKYLTLDALLYQELPMICRGEQSHEFFQHTQNVTIFLFFLSLEFSVRDRKKHLSEGESNFPTLLHYGPDLHTFSHT